MIQVVYISTARHAPSESELDTILAISRRNNAAAGITGLLVSGGRRFLQVLEGPADAVAATLERIKADRRHFAIVLLNTNRGGQRQFGSWSMAFERAGEPAGAASLSDTVEALVAPLSDPNLRAQFIGFAELHAKAA